MNLELITLKSYLVLCHQTRRGSMILCVRLDSILVLDRPFFEQLEKMAQRRKEVKKTRFGKTSVGRAMVFMASPTSSRRRQMHDVFWMRLRQCWQTLAKKKELVVIWRD